MNSWKDLLEAESKQAYFHELTNFIAQERHLGKIIYPSDEHIFEAFHLTPLEFVSVVILGQDPYHGPNQAHGLAFSVKQHNPIPPSLKNIFTELNSDLQLPIPKHGNLSTWAEQGVLLLNATLSVEHCKAGSHAKIGWENFTDKVINLLSEEYNGLIFLLWGTHARSKKKFINAQKHFVLEAPHPSPLSAYRGFFGCKHFSKTNDILQKLGKKAIDWSLPSLETLSERLQS